MSAGWRRFRLAAPNCLVLSILTVLFFGLACSASAVELGYQEAAELRGRQTEPACLQRFPAGSPGLELIESEFVSYDDLNGGCGKRFQELYRYAGGDTVRIERKRYFYATNLEIFEHVLEDDRISILDKLIFCYEASIASLESVVECGGGNGRYLLSGSDIDRAMQNALSKEDRDLALSFRMAPIEVWPEPLRTYLYVLREEFWMLSDCFEQEYGYRPSRASTPRIFAD